MTRWSGWAGRSRSLTLPRSRGLAPLACKTDRIDAWVLAELSRRDLVPAIWLPSFELRRERERARWRLFLVRKRAGLKNRIHAQLLACGHRCSVSDLFGHKGRELLARQISEIDQELKDLGAEHRYIPLVGTVPGIAWVLGYTIASESGDIHRFSSPTKLCGYTGLCPRVYQSEGTDRRGHLTHAGPRHLRWALIEAIWQMLTRHQPFAPAGAANALAA
jgi:transposase